MDVEAEALAAAAATEAAEAAELAAASAAAQEAEAIETPVAAIEGVAAAEAGAALAHAQAAAAEMDAAERLRRYEEEGAEWRSRHETMMADLSGRIGALTQTFQTFSGETLAILSSIQPPSEPIVAVTIDPASVDGQEDQALPPQRRKRRFLR